MTQLPLNHLAAPHISTFFFSFDMDRDHLTLVHLHLVAHSLHEGREKEAALASEIPGLEQRLQYCIAEQKASDEKAARLTREADQVEGEADGRQAQVDGLSSGLKERRAKVEGLTARINEVADRWVTLVNTTGW